MIKAIPGRLLALLLALLLVLGLSATAFAAETVQLKTPEADGSVAFAVSNMFPGDAETKDFTVRVKHKEPIVLYYRAEIRPGYEKLAEVMMVRVELPEKGLHLYDGLMRDMPAALEYSLAADEKAVVYRITAYLDTSVGNDYQYKGLVADFCWWYAEEEESVSSQPGDTTSSDVSSQPGDTTSSDVSSQPGDTTSSDVSSQPGDTTSSDVSSQPGDTTSSDVSSQPGEPGTPPTGDGSGIVLYTVLLTVSGAALFFLLLFRKRNKEEENNG